MTVTTAPARLVVGLAPMQFSDRDAEHKSDAARVFARAEAKGYAALIGTEASVGAGRLPEYLEDEAHAHGYRFHRRHGTWLAVAKRLGPEVDRGYVKVIGSHTMEHEPTSARYDPRGIPWLTVDATRHGIGNLTVGVSHFLTKGRQRGQTPAGPANHYRLNDELSAAIGEWAADHGKGKGLVLWGADTNRLDSTGDVFNDLAPLTTCWDDLGKWPNTGHGNIDVLARYDRDGRVSCAWARSLNDAAYPLATDHYLTEAAYDVELLP